VISRSTYAGSGGHGGHWLGDNGSSWNDLYESIPGLLAFQLFGIPLVGADICGFGGTPTVELCSRWMQLGSFYPFSRNHNSIGNPDQDPVSMGQQVTDVSRAALNIRYSLLPYLYTLFYHAHITGDTVARPLWFEFPTDKSTHSIDKQFLWGKSLLISPVLEEGSVTVLAYFPAAKWYDLLSGALVPGTGSQGISVTLEAPINVIPLHLRGGAIILTQQPNITTTYARLQPFGLLAALDSNNSASGDAFLDDGDSLNTYEDGHYSYLTYSIAGTNPLTFASTIVKSNYSPSSSSYLSFLAIFGFPAQPKQVTLNGAAATKFTYNANKVFNLTLSLNLMSPLSVVISY